MSNNNPLWKPAAQRVAAANLTAFMRLVSRHALEKILQADDIPRAKSNKIVELPRATS